MPRASPWREAHDGGALGLLSATWRSYPPRGPSTESSSIFVRVLFSDLIFEGNFRGLLVLKMGHVTYRRKDRDVYFPTI
jgi:hypothetical protein